MDKEHRQRIFNYFSENHGITLLESEIDDAATVFENGKIIADETLHPTHIVDAWFWIGLGLIF